jgi:hypothetical protein
MMSNTHINDLRDGMLVRIIDRSSREAFGLVGTLLIEPDGDDVGCYVRADDGRLFGVLPAEVVPYSPAGRNDYSGDF